MLVITYIWASGFQTSYLLSSPPQKSFVPDSTRGWCPPDYSATNNLVLIGEFLFPFWAILGNRPPYTTHPSASLLGTHPGLPYTPPSLRFWAPEITQADLPFMLPVSYFAKGYSRTTKDHGISFLTRYLLWQKLLQFIYDFCGYIFGRGVHSNLQFRKSIVHISI